MLFARNGEASSRYIEPQPRPAVTIGLEDCQLWPRPLLFNYRAVLERLRPVRVVERPTCTHPVDEQVQREGQTVCTACGLVYGNIYEAPLYVTVTSGLTVQRRHFYRPEAYLKLHLKSLGKDLPNWAARRLHHIWPYIYKIFRRVVAEDEAARPQKNLKKKRKNMLCYSYCIEQLLGRWGCDTTGLRFKSLKTVSRRREVNRLWSLMASRFPDHL